MTIQVGDTVRAVPVDPDPSYWVHREGYLWLVTWVSEDLSFVEFKYLATGRRERWGVRPCDVHPNQWLVPATRFYLESINDTTI